MIPFPSSKRQQTACLLCLVAVSLLAPSHAFSATVGSALSPAAPQNVLQDFDFKTESCLPWMEQGYQSWTWRGHKINYLEMGDRSKPALLLIHGFGASVFHYRYNIPVLARDYHVFAIDMLGFGLSDKPLENYSAEIWRDQTVDFVKEIIQKPVTLAGNSLGGYTALYASATDQIKDQVKGCVLLNAAGRFRNPNAPADEEIKSENFLVVKLKEFLQRLVIRASFVYTKQPSRIEQVLRQVYPVDDSNVNAELVQSIQYPSLHPNAAEVFYRVITKNGSGPQAYVDDLLQKLDCPLLLCWGESDPWVSPAAADRIQALYPASQRVSINAGHCPHDEAPDAVNEAIAGFMKQIHAYN